VATRAEKREALYAASEAAALALRQELQREAYEFAWSKMPPGYTGTAWVPLYEEYLAKFGLGPTGKPYRRPN
jgi:hypothetical protein